MPVSRPLPPRPPRLPPRLARRALLGAVGGTVGVGLVTAVSGCGARTTSATPSSNTGDAGGGTGDADLVTRALEVALGSLASIDATTRRHPGLRADLRPLAATQEAVADLLSGAAGDTGGPSPSATPDPSPAPGRRGAARAAVLADARDALDAYVDLAGRADSGRLARVLAAAGAGIAQGLAALDGPDAVLLPEVVDLSAADASDDAVEALQTTLAAEHAAVWALPVVGARALASDSPGSAGPGDLGEQVDEAYAVHLAQRDALTEALREAEVEPVAASPAYEPLDLGDATPPADRARQDAAVAVEDACTTTYAWLVAGTAGDRRAWAVSVLLESAVRRVRLGGEPQELPGT